MSAETVQGWVPTDDFGARLLLARKHAGLTVREAAVRCGIHYATWSTWERGARPANMAAEVQKVSRGIGADRDWLMWGGPLRPEAPPQSLVTVAYPWQGFRSGWHHRRHGLRVAPPNPLALAS